MVKLRGHFKESVSNVTPRRGNDVIRLHGETIPDPYWHLGNLEASSTQAWIQAEEENYSQFVGPPDSQTKDSLTAILNAPQKGIPTRAGDHYLFYYQAAEDKNPRVMISDTAEGTGRTFIDPHDFDSSGISSVVSVAISPDKKNVGYIIRKNPKEAWLRIRNLETGKDLPDVVLNPGNGMKWDKDGKGFSYYVFPEVNLGLVKHHTLGADPAKDPVLHEGTQQEPSVGFESNSPVCHVFYQGSREWLFTGVASGDPKKSLSLKDPNTGEYRKLFEAGIAQFEPIADTEDGVLMLTTLGAPNGKVVLFNPDTPAPENWKTVIPERDTKLKYIFLHQDKLVSLYNGNHVMIFDKQGKPAGEVPLPAHSASVLFSRSTRSGVSLGIGAPDTAEKDLFMSVTGVQQQPVVYRYNFDTDNLTALDPPPENAVPDNFIVEKLLVESKDGTKVPMTVVRKPGVALDGTAALKLGGYGGFGTSGGGDFEAETLDFIRSGGIYAYADVRGGGGVDSDWHNGGRLLNKQNCFDDFTACAQYLIDNKYTSSSRLVAEGSSNGGTLVLTSMIQHPRLFGAVIANCPSADKLDKVELAFKQEFGDPFANKKDFENIRAYSPLQNIQEGQQYPPCLIRTGVHDFLLQGALKFVAAMQHDSPQSTTLLHVEKDFGHGVMRPKDVEIKEAADKKAFIERSIGPIDQNAYRQELAAGRGTRPRSGANPSA